MPTSPDDIMEHALNVKSRMDELILLSDKLYVCAECGVVSDYWKPGQVCAQCEYEGERQFEQARGN